MSISLETTIRRFSTRNTFTIARGSKDFIEVVTVTLKQGGHMGRGECVPYARYGETQQSVLEAIEALAAEIKSGLSRQELQNRLPAGAARNALDCAFWDLEAKISQKPVWQLAKLPEPQELLTAYTLSLDTPDQMAAQAARNADRPLLKVKLGTGDNLARLQSIQQAAPDAHLILDANEALTPDSLEQLISNLTGLNVALIEQPLPADDDERLTSLNSPIPLCADESIHDRHSLEGIAGKYSYINIKLDKTGGLTEALALARQARNQGLGLMVGCMLGSSLAMAPAMLVAGQAEFVDLDGPLLLAEDHPNPLVYNKSTLYPAPRLLWG